MFSFFLDRNIYKVSLKSNSLVLNFGLAGQQVQIIDVYKEIAEIMKGFKTGMKFMTKTVDRKNVFDDDEEVPTESVYLKMLYDAKCNLNFRESAIFKLLFQILNFPEISLETRFPAFMEVRVLVWSFS